MYIPQVGMDCLYVAREASPADNRQAEVRPAKIVKVNSYGVDSCSCNLMVMLDGEGDIKNFMNPGAINGFQMHIQDVTFDLNGNTNTFKWLQIEPNRCEIVRVRSKITHGRETIRAGAKGLWDQAKNTITFNDSDITGKGADQTATYVADHFIDQHCARLDCPNNLTWALTRSKNVGLDMERPWERNRMLDSMFKRDLYHFGQAHRPMMEALFESLGLPTPPGIEEPEEMWQTQRSSEMITEEAAGGERRQQLKLNEGRPGVQEQDTRQTTRRRDEMPAGAR